MNMVFTMGFRVQIFGRRCALEPSFFFVKRQYTEQLTDKQGEQFTEDSISQKQQASDERLWAGLCLGKFWSYVNYRWEISKKCNISTVKQHYLFGFGARRSLTRNAMSRLWWIGRLTYDETRPDPWELTEFVCENADYIMHTLERNFSNNPAIIHPFLSAIIDARKNGLRINTDIVGELSKYLNLLGGIYILDCLPYSKIYEKIYTKIEEINS